MKKLLTILLVLFPLMMWGQDYESKGDSAYKAGDYEEAEVQYNAALALLKAQKVDENSPEYLLLERKLTRARTCLPLMQEARMLMAAAKANPTEEAFGKAKKAYQAILLKNSEDRSARQQILACDAGINTLLRNREDEALWAKVQEMMSKSAYETYLAEFPDGLHSSEAKSSLMKIEDDQLWFHARSENTVDAYNRYIAQSKTSDHLSEARYAICVIHDDQVWETLKDGQDEQGLKAYISDTSNVCKQYLDKANAYLTVIRTKRYAMADDADARQIVADLSKAQESVVFDAETKRILEEKKAVVDYEDFVENPTIEAGERYLERYPASVSIYRDRVSDKVAQLYADSFTMTSTSADRDRAKGYAVSRNVRDYVEDRFDSISKKRRATKRRNAWDERFQIGIGVDGEFIRNFAWGPRLEFKIGSADDVFNFSFGAKYYMWNQGQPDNEDGKDTYRPKLGVDQIPLFAVIKFNLADLGSSNVCKLYLAAEGSYNINFNSRFKAPDLSGYWASTEDTGYYPGLWKGENVADPAIVFKNNITAGARIGFNWRKFDLGIYGKYDVTPMFDTEYLSTAPGYAWDVISPAANARFRFGVSLIYYMIL